MTCPYCSGTGCEDCHDGTPPCVMCDAPAVIALDGDPLCRRCLTDIGCAECGERHHTDDHGHIMRERAIDARDRRIDRSAA
jgi:hypothetical protein